METRPKPSSSWMVSFTAAATRGLIREPRVRRKMMIGAILIAATLALCGVTLLADFLSPRERPLWFIGYWLGCAWMTLLAILLSVFDLLMARAQARALDKILRDQLARAARLDPDNK